MTQTYPKPPKFHAIVLCEPMMAPTDLPVDPTMAKTTSAWPAMTLKRRDIWPTREDALTDFLSKKSFQVYDPEVFRIYVVSTELQEDLPCADPLEGIWSKIVADRIIPR